MVVVDELLALTTMASPDIRHRILAATISITSKSRKMGISFVGATTAPPTARWTRKG
jgi:hypothetical protein